MHYFSSDLFMGDRSCDSRNHEVDWSKKIYTPACFICTRKNIFAEMIEKKWLKEIYSKYMWFFNITDDKYPNTITVYCRFLVNHIVWNKWREIAFNYWNEKKKTRNHIYFLLHFLLLPSLTSDKIASICCYLLGWVLAGNMSDTRFKVYYLTHVTGLVSICIRSITCNKVTFVSFFYIILYHMRSHDAIDFSDCIGYCPHTIYGQDSSVIDKLTAIVIVFAWWIIT